MKSYFLALAAALATLSAANAEVHLLNDNNFEAFVKSQDYSLVKFFAPWCGHCKNLAPAYVAASDKLAPKYKIAEVDCTAEDSKALCEKQGVRGYPTLKGFSPDLSSVEYEDARSEDAIVAHVLAATSPAVTFITTADELKEFKAGPQDLKLVINTAQDSDVAKVIQHAAKNLRKAAAIAIDTTNTDGKVTLYRSFDEPEVAFTGDVNATALAAFVNTNSLPIIGEIGPHNYKKYVDRNVPLVWIFIDYDNAEQVAALEALKPVAKDFNDKVAFAKLDGKKWAQHAKSFGLQSATPGIVIEDRTSKKKFAYPEGFALNTADFKTYLDGFVAKTLTPIFKSQPIPEKNDAALTKIVGKNYDEIVKNEATDVFVKFYAEWCGHCKSLAPKWEALAEMYKDDANVVIAELDATENDFDGPEVTGFPTIYFFPAGNKANPIRFNGDRTEEAMKEFVEEHRKTTPAAAKKAAHEEL